MSSSDFLDSLPTTRAFQRYKAVFHDSPATAIRLNPGKPSPSWLKEENGLSRVPWCPYGIILTRRPDFTRDPAFHQGRYYVQEPASMFIHHVVSQLCKAAAPRVLDACAAPGGKTTAVLDALLAAGLTPSLFVANEFDPRRAAALRENIAKHGSGLVSVTVGAAQRYGAYKDSFDLIIVDAPCSGEGMMRKEPAALSQWSPQLVESCASAQREITHSLFPSLRPGGLMIYSTCTYNRRENEEVIESLVYDFQALSVPVPGVDPSWGIQPGIGTTAHCYRFIPGSTVGEGLFMAIMRKPGETSDSETGLKKININPPALTFPGEKTLPGFPTHSLLLDRQFDFSHLNTCDVGLQVAIDYLRGNSIKIDAPKGPVLLTYEHFPLGMVKNIGSRANNLYPPSLRIRSTY